MNRLIVFDRHERARDYGYRRAHDEDATEEVKWEPGKMQLVHENGDRDYLAVIASDRDLDRYRGLPINAVEYKAPVSPYCRDSLRAMIRPLPEVNL